MNQNNENAELLDLLDGLFNDRMNDEQHSRLQELLRDDPAAQQMYFAYLDMHLGLRHIAAVEAGSEGLAPSSDKMKPILEKSGVLPRKRRFHPALQVGLVASLLVCMSAIVGVFLLKKDDPSQLPAAVKVKYVSGHVAIRSADGQVRTATVGVQVSAGESIETTGPQSVAIISYEDQTAILMAVESIVVINSQPGKHLTVKKGTISASVATQPSGMPMVIKTLQARVDVLGTEFVLSAADRHTDLKVAEGRVKLTRIADGESVVVDEGKRVIAGDSPQLSVQSAVPPPDLWNEDFESGLPDGWQCGRHVAVGLPPGSKGAVKAAGNGDSYSIVTPHAWMDGLFVVHPDSHLNVIYKMDQPKWINIFFITRTDSPQDPTTFLHKFGSLPTPKRHAWYTASIPLSRFQRWTGERFGDDPPGIGELAFAMSWTAPDLDRGLVIDRVWVSRGGPGEVTVEEAE